jgi:ribonucleoside-diphosphate reductase beta chain
MTPREAINWNDIPDPYTLVFWQQNLRQFWVDEEIPLSADKNAWSGLNKEEKELYKRVLAGLTLLDTEQGSVGMPRISLAVEQPHAKAILSFMGFMEHMHAKSYSSIFSTLCGGDEITNLFNWVRGERSLQEKTHLILDHYHRIEDDKSLYLAMVTSTFLESFLFYSGFFYPLLLSGQGSMVNSGEIINLIIRDESLHGVYVGLLAQKLFERFTMREQGELNREVVRLAEQLLEIEQRYTKSLYGSLALQGQVETYSRYNCSKAFMNLGLEPLFNIRDEDVNPLVLRGLETKTKNHDFFSTKGNSYTKALKVEEMSDEDFNI